MSTLKKKIAIIVGAGILIGLAVIGWTSKTPEQVSIVNSSPTPSSFGSNIPLAQVSTAPQREFAADEDKSYNIVYDPNYDMYIISVLATPFDKIRVLAEQALIKRLNLSQSVACAQLKVHIGSPRFANPNQTESYDTFSFCTN